MKKLLIAFTFAIFLCAGVAMPAEAKSVYYNTNTQIYHNPNCKWAKKCTKNCIIIDDKDARARGGRPCKVCGG